MKKNKRIQFIDVARGISILLMIIGHVTTQGTIRNFIYSFHMPLFIIISGYFYKKRPLKEELKKSIIHLLLPITIVIFIITFIQNRESLNIFSSIIESIKTITVCWSHQSKITYNFFSTESLWFIYMLVLMKLLFITTKKISKNNDVLLLFLILIETYIGYIVGTNGYWLPWSIDISFACIIFYYLGYIIKKHNLLTKILKNNILIIIFYILWLSGVGFSSIEIAVRRYPYGIISYITAICGSIIVFKLSYIIERKLKKLTNILSWCGKNSLYILSVHYIETALITYNINIANTLLNNTLISSIKIIISTSIAFIYTNVLNLFKSPPKQLKKRDKI